MCKSADENELQFADVESATVKKWGDFEAKLKWRLKHEAKSDGFILQVVTITYRIYWVNEDGKCGELLTKEEVFNDVTDWETYSEVWPVDEGEERPSGSWDGDVFSFESIEGTCGWYRQEGVAYFFESDNTAKQMGFRKHPQGQCPAGSLPAQKGVYHLPDAALKTPHVTRSVEVHWNEKGDVVKRTVVPSAI